MVLSAGEEDANVGISVSTVCVAPAVKPPLIALPPVSVIPVPLEFKSILNVPVPEIEVTVTVLEVPLPVTPVILPVTPEPSIVKSEAPTPLTLSVKVIKKDTEVAFVAGLPVTVMLLAVGATALEITVVVLFVSVSAPSFITTVNLVVSDIAALLSVGLKLEALKVLCIVAAVALAIVYGPEPDKPVPDKTPLALSSSVIVAVRLSPSASVIVIEEKGAIVFVSITP